MKALVLVLRVLGYAWCAAAFLLILAGTIGVFVSEGLWAALWLFSPFNIWNWLAVVAAILPGGGVILLANRLAEKLD